MSNLKVFVLMAGLTALFVAIGGALGGQGGMLFALLLADALRRLELAARRIPMEVSPAVASLAQVNPLAAYGSGLARLFSTHPPTEERIARLEAMVMRYQRAA
jgi:Zn-dependent protease with chaperone function